MAGSSGKWRVSILLIAGECYARLKFLPREDSAVPGFALRPVTLLIFLSRAAWARIVAPDFLLRANHLLHRLRVARSGHARLFQFAPLAAHESLFQFVGGC